MAPPWAPPGDIHIEQCISDALAQVSQDAVVTEVVSLLIVKSKSVAFAPPILRGLSVPSEFRIVCGSAACES